MAVSVRVPVPTAPGDALVAAAETLIVSGKERGYLAPDDILASFPDIDAEPDHLERIFAVFRDMGIDVSDGERGFDTVEEVDDATIGEVEAADSAALDDPVRMYLKE